MDLVETEYVETKTVTGIYIFLSLLFSIYAVSILVCSIWGTAVVPKNCFKSDLRYALRGLMVTSVMSFIAYISYGICVYSCRKVEQGGTGGVKMLVDTELSLPTWILIFTLAISIANLYFLVVMNNGFSNECSNGSVQNFQNYLKFCIATTSLVMIVIIVILGYRIYKNPEARRLRSKTQEQYNKAIGAISLTTRSKEKASVDKLVDKRKQVERMKDELEEERRKTKDAELKQQIAEEEQELEKEYRLLVKQIEVERAKPKMEKPKMEKVEKEEDIYSNMPDLEEDDGLS